MAEQKLCSACAKVEATVNCSECGVPLCDACVREVQLDDASLGYHVMGQNLSSMRPGKQVKKVCLKCLKEVDFL